MDTGVVGRDAELTIVQGFLESVAGGFAALALEGEAGIGKTTLWRAAHGLAAQRGMRVMRCRPAPGEAKLSFAALADLLSAVDDSAFAGLPPPQRDALSVALLREAPQARAPAPRAVAVGFLGLVRALAAVRPVLVAVDDWQWLDLSSQRVLEFAARRLEPEPVGLLCSIRSPVTGPLLGGAVTDDRLRRLAIGSLSLASLGRVIAASLNRSLPRPVLARIAEASRGNPFYALEIARLVGDRNVRDVAVSGLPVPDDLRRLTAGRIRRLPPETRETVLLAAVMSAPDTRSLDANALGPAEDAGIVTVDEAGRVEFTHPLLASAAYGSVALSRRRALHRHAAELVSDPEQRARHLALACDEPEAAVADQLQEAAALAASRGAPDAAAGLSELAAQLTPDADVAARGERLLVASRFQFDAGDLARSEELAKQVLTGSPTDALRARGLQRLAHLQGRRNNFTQAAELAAQALAVAAGDHQLQATAELELAYCSASLGDPAGAAEHSRASIEHATEAGDDAGLASALACLTIVVFMGGGSLDTEQLERALAVPEPREAPLVLQPRYIDGVLRLWLGDLDGSLTRLSALYDEAFERGQEGGAPMLLLYMVQARLWKGDLQEAGDLAARAREAAALLNDPTASAIALAAGALVHAYAGSREAGTEAQEALALFEHLQWRPGAIWPLWALGLLELAEDRPAGVDRVLAPLAEQLLAMGGGDPCLFVFLPDEIEALIALGELERAERYLDPFEASARERDRDWAVAVAGRCRGLLHSARGDAPAAYAAFDDALTAHDRVTMPLERARTLLVAGRSYRRFKQRGTARELLEEARSLFEAVGAPIWADKAHAELARVGRPGPGGGQLTGTERRLAELAASGLSNREVAEHAFVSVKTVESNLTRVYRKLGVRSRVELANALRGEGG